MTLREYFRGRPILLSSPLSPQRVTERVNAEAASPYRPFATGVVGRIWRGRISLRFSSSPLEYNAKPILTGRLLEGPSGSVLELRYRGPAFGCFFLVLWYVLLGLFLLAFITGDPNPDLGVGDWLLVAGFYLLMLFMPVIFHHMGTRTADDDLATLLDFLHENADAIPSA